MQQRERARQMSEMQKLNATESNCFYCRQSPKFLGHLVVATGTTCYLALHARAIVDGHCFIAPVDHVVSGSVFDETTADEVRNFKKSLIQMFASIGKDCIFYETVMYIKKNPHTCIECIPVAKRWVHDLAVALACVRSCFRATLTPAAGKQQSLPAISRKPFLNTEVNGALTLKSLT